VAGHDHTLTNYRPQLPHSEAGAFFDREQVAMSGVDRASGGILAMCVNGLSAVPPRRWGRFFVAGASGALRPILGPGLLAALALKHADGPAVCRIEHGAD
jgi:hypothetical protein